MTASNYRSGQEIENDRNAVERRCRIGKITPKHRAGDYLRKAAEEYQRSIKWPLMQNEWHQTFGLV